MNDAPDAGDLLEAIAGISILLLLDSSWLDHVREALERLGVATGVTRAYVLEFEGGDDILRFVERGQWSLPGFAPRTTIVRSEIAERAVGDVLRRGRTFTGRITEPPEREGEAVADQGLKGIAAAPIFTDGRWWGLLGFEECRSDRPWTAQQIQALETIAACLGAAIQRERAGSELEVAEVRFRTLVEQIPAMTYVDQVEGSDDGMYVSPQIRQLLGFEPEDWYREPGFWHRRLHPEDEPAIWAAWRRSVEHGGLFEQEYRMVAKDGSVVWVSERTTILPDEDGRPRFIHGVLTDISRFKETEERFRIVFEASPIGIMLIGKDLRILDANPALCRLLQFPRDDVRSMSFFDVTHPEDVAEGTDLWNRVFTGEISSFSIEKRYVAGDGEAIWVNLTGSGVHDESSVATYGIAMVEDIRPRKRSQAEMLQAAAAAAQRLARLSPREREVLELLAARSLTAQQIATDLHISVRTAESHLASAYRKLDVSSREAAANEYRKLRSTALQALASPEVRTDTPYLRTEVP